MSRAVQANAPTMRMATPKQRAAAAATIKQQRSRPMPQQHNSKFADYISPADAANFGRSHAEDHAADCLCTICNCGAHRCPPDRVQGRYKNIKSEQQAQFTGQYLPPQRVAKEAYVHQHRPFEGTTTNQADFKYWGNAAPRQPAEAARRNNGVLNNDLPFQGVTTNQHDFRRWNAKPAQLTTQTKGRPVYVQDDRSFATEVSAQFDQKNYRPRKSCAPNQNATVSLPFEGVTTQQADFVKQNAAPARSTQHKRVYRPRREDREFTTEARGQFVEKEFDVCPAKSLYRTTKDRNGHVLVDQRQGKWGYTMDDEYR